MLTGKGGVVSVHIGDAPKGLSLIEKLEDESDIPISQFLPTHITRNPARVLRLPQKGELASGKDADLLLLNARLQVHSVWARGRRLVGQQRLQVPLLLAS